MNKVIALLFAGGLWANAVAYLIERAQAQVPMGYVLSEISSINIKISSMENSIMLLSGRIDSMSIALNFANMRLNSIGSGRQEPSAAANPGSSPPSK